MASLVEVTAYRLGIRLTQCRHLHQRAITGRSGISGSDVGVADVSLAKRAIRDLELAYREFCRLAEPCEGVLGIGLALIRDCRRLWNAWSKVPTAQLYDADVDDGEFVQNLETFTEHITQIAEDTTGEGRRTVDWLELGRQITDGLWYSVDDRRHSAEIAARLPRSRRSNKSWVHTYAEWNWTWSDPDEVCQLLRAIAVKKDDLFPTTNDDATSRRLLPYDRIDYGPWYRVEAGLIRLLHNTESVQQSPARPCPEVTEEVQGTSHGGKDSSTRIAAGTAINHDSQDSQDLSPPSPPQPRWDKDHRRLLIGDKILREYRHHPAKNQTTILASFEELGWSKRIDVPILKIKLQPTLRELNKGIKPKVIRFRADGTGKGIIWEYVGKATKKSSKSS